MTAVLPVSEKIDPWVDHDPSPIPRDRTGKISYMAVCQNLVPLVNIKIAGKWMFIP